MGDTTDFPLYSCVAIVFAALMAFKVVMAVKRGEVRRWQSSPLVLAQTEPAKFRTIVLTDIAIVVVVACASAAML